MAGSFMHLDESIKGDLIVVAGFVCTSEDIAEVTDQWTAMREELELDEDDPLKWNYGQSNAVRAALEARGWGRPERRRLVIDTIRAMPITLLGDAIYDTRNSRRTPLDYYKDALDWLLLRYRNWVTDPPAIADGPHMVVLDQPSAAQAARPSEDPRLSWLKHRESIWYRIYNHKYSYGWRFLYARHEKVHGLRDDGFYPSVVISHAKHNPLLEVADAVAGLTLDFVYYNLHEADGEELPTVSWQDEQFIRAAPKFRAKSNGDVLTYGFDLFPRAGRVHVNLTNWVTQLCTSPDFAYLRDD